MERPPPLLGAYYKPLYIMTGIAAGAIILGIILPKGPNGGITRSCVVLTALSLWLFWSTVYISQMNPLMGPRLPNTTLAWMSKTWGLPLNLTEAKQR